MSILCRDRDINNNVIYDSGRDEKSSEQVVFRFFC